MCVGPRSAVFAPLADIGLIVVDEEHDASYKHEGDPRYDARAVALHRAEQHGAVVLAGSATPRPESAVALTRLRLPKPDRRPLAAAGRGARHARRPPSAPPPDADGAGRRAERRRQGDRPAQPARLVELPVLPRLRARVDVPELRGRARAAPSLRPFVLPSLRPPPARRRAGASVRLGRGSAPRRGDRERRAGAARGVRRRASGVPARRRRRRRQGPPGSDARGVRGGAAPASWSGRRWSRKGHDFAEVALGVVLDADQTLRFPDFRAEERTFALVTQLAGRVGRGEDQARRPGAGPDAGAGRRIDRVRGSPRLRRLSRAGARAAQGARISAIRVADPDRLLGARTRRRLSRWLRACTV